MDTETLTKLFAWMTVLNTGFLLFATVMLWALRDWATGVHGAMFALADDDLRRSYFEYLSRYKILILVFNLAPYIALRIVA